MDKLKKILESLYKKYNRKSLIPPDPLQFVYKYNKPEDMELAGFLAAMLAYGRVEQIEKDVGRLLGAMDGKPYKFILDFDKNKRVMLKDIKHRFNTSDDICDLIEVLKVVLEKHKSIENYFLSFYKPNDVNILPALSKFCDGLFVIHSQIHRGKLTPGFRFFLPKPEDGSACKRLNLFLRWMVRNDDVDSGLWRKVDKSKLIVPVDVHMGRLCKILGLYKQKNVSIKAAVEITESFKKIEPNDPVKYDFAISRIGIIEDCNGKLRSFCENCELYCYCSIGIEKG